MNLIQPNKALILCLLLTFSYLAKAQLHLDTVKIESIDVLVSKQLNAFNGSRQADSIFTQAYSNKSLAELFVTHSGLQVLSFGQGNTSTVSFRGTGASHTLVLWNGIRLNSPLTGQFDFSLIPGFFIDNINIAPGNSSIQSGNGGLGGCIDLSNSLPADSKKRFLFSKEIGSFGLNRTALSYSAGSKSLFYRVRYQYEASENDFEFENKIPEKVIMKQKNAESMQHTLLLELSHRIGKTNLISLKQWSNLFDRKLPPLSLNYENSEHHESSGGQLHAGSINWNHYSDKLSFLFQSAWRFETINYLLEKEISGGALIRSFDSYNQATSYINRLNVKSKIDKRIALWFNAEQTRHQIHLVDKVLQLNTSPSRNELNMTVIVKYKPFSFITVKPLVSKQWVKGMDIPLTWSLALETNFASGTNFFGSLAKNYKIPSMNDLYFVPGGNPDLKAEEGNTFDAGLESHFTLKQIKINIKATVYSSRINNWILWTDTDFGYWTPENLQQVLAQGFESQVRFIKNLNDNSLIQSSFSYNLCSSVYTGSEAEFSGMKDKQLLYVPKNSFNFSTYVKTGNFSFLLDNQTTGERPYSFGNSEDLASMYSLWNLVFSVNLPKDKGHSKFSLGIQNLLDESYTVYRYRPMPGRNYFLKFEFTLN